MSQPQYLYHYTDFNGLKGIIDSQNLWLSNRKCVNDTKEFNHSQGLIKIAIEEATKNFIENQKSNLSLTPTKKNNAKEVILETIWKKLPEAYLFSFCVHGYEDIQTRKNGLLSMWRGYGNEGYALVFNKEKVGEYLNKLDSFCPAGQIFEDVTYLKEDDPARLCESRHEDYAQLLELIENNLIPHKPLENRMAENEELEAYKALLRLIVLIKDNSFIEENEYRLCFFNYPMISLPDKSKHVPLKIRKRGSSMVSFIEFPLNMLSASIEDFVKHIIIGPQRDMELKQEFLESYLRSQGLTKITVSTSKIPYLDR